MACKVNYLSALIAAGSSLPILHISLYLCESFSFHPWVSLLVSIGSAHYNSLSHKQQQE